MIESIKTREARQVLAQAEEFWKGHEGTCRWCDHARVSRHPGNRCQTGKRLHGQLEAARQDLKDEQAADAAPNPAQAPLFDVGELV